MRHLAESGSVQVQWSAEMSVWSWNSWALYTGPPRLASGCDLYPEEISSWRLESASKHTKIVILDSSHADRCRLLLRLLLPFRKSGCRSRVACLGGIPGTGMRLKSNSMGCSRMAGVRRLPDVTARRRAASLGHRASRRTHAKLSLLKYAQHVQILSRYSSACMWCPTT